MTYDRISDDKYKKALFQLKGQMRESLYEIFGKMYENGDLLNEVD
ncbi:hypothetical protein LCGC14_2562310 [marine sediment metagenome]|uniref:Uncharacterized protein n=1 Tax=marine sediment metagenome TaxID=412755 RepID=A0A0F9AJN1_9ZZZZ